MACVIIRKNRYILLLILLFELIIPDSFSQGLQFHSNKDLIEFRTSYNVFAKKQPAFKDFLEIRFDLSINSPESFGFILYVKDDENNHHYNLGYTNENDSLNYLKFSIDSKETVMTIPLLKMNLGKRKWVNIIVKLDAINDSIELNVDNIRYRIKADFSSNKFKPLVFFGKHNSFIDVPDISIRNLKISGENKTISFHFNEIEGSQVHDSEGIERGSIENPIWLINDSFSWKLRFNFNSNKVTAINYDSKHQRFVFINNDSLCFYDISNNVLIKNKLPKRTPVPLRLGLSFISDNGNELSVYEINDVGIDKPTLATLNLETLQWKLWSFDQLEKQSHHHISSFNQEKGEYIIFGGYGNKEYSNKFYSIAKSDSTWQKLDFTGDTISPRFFSGSTKRSKNELLIFGGAGNSSGDQSTGKIYYTDCYLVNLHKKNIKKLWDSNSIFTKMVSGTNLILSSDSLSFYTIYYPEYIPHTFLKLYKFSIKTGEYEILGDSIPMISERIRTNANLYFNGILNELYCVTQEFKLDGSSIIKIYSISSPPVSKIDYYSETTNLAKYRFIYIIFALLGVLILYFVWRHFKHKRKLEIQRLLVSEDRNSIIKPTNQFENSVYLFGIFKVYDRRGKEISYLFSPKIQQLFLLVLLNSDKNKVTSNDIYSVLWPEKPTQKAKNSKGVVLNQLRKIIADIDGLELLNENRHLYFKTSAPFYCDYFDYQSYIKILKSNESSAESVLSNLFTVVSRGRFLQFVDLEYFDTIKQHFENEALLIIPYQLGNYFKKENYNKVIQLCKIIYNIDMLNELVFHYELISYVKLNMPGKARKRFNAFSIEYKNEFNDDYIYTFGDLVSNKSIEFIKKNSID